MQKKDFARLNFPKFVPEIDILDDRSWFWKEGIRLPMIFVLLWQLLDERSKEALSKASSKGLHDYLGHDGKILLSTVMPDEMLDKLKKDDYFKLIENLRPDAAMIPDNFAYTDAPLYQSWTQTIKLVNYAGDFLHLDIPLIGLIKGANGLQIRWTVERQLEMGYVSFAIPARELLDEGMLSDFLYARARQVMN